LKVGLGFRGVDEGEMKNKKGNGGFDGGEIKLFQVRGLHSGLGFRVRVQGLGAGGWFRV
jgi:hypothetical protein